MVIKLPTFLPGRARLGSWPKALRGAHSLVIIGLVAAVLIVVNALAAYRDVRWDWSETRRFTLAPQTLDVLKHLPQEVTGIDGETLLEYLSRRTGVVEAEAALDEAAAALADDADLVHRHAEALERFLALGGDDLATRAAAACTDVGLGESANLEMLSSRSTISLP